MHRSADNSGDERRIYQGRARLHLMIASRPRKADAVLILLGLVIFIVLILAVILLVRRQPQLGPQAPGTSALRVPPVNGHRSPASVAG